MRRSGLGVEVEECVWASETGLVSYTLGEWPWSAKASGEGSRGGWRGVRRCCCCCWVGWDCCNERWGSEPATFSDDGMWKLAGGEVAVVVVVAVVLVEIDGRAGLATEAVPLRGARLRLLFCREEGFGPRDFRGEALRWRGRP